MGSPVQIPDLPPAPSANDADQTIIRQGLTDYRATLTQIRNINLSSLTLLPSSAATTDLLLISRVVTGTPTNFKIPFINVGVPMGSRMWFHMTSTQMDATLPGWQRDLTVSDCLLSTKGGSVYTNANQILGTWQQPLITLQIFQIPAHSHLMQLRSIPGSLNYALAVNSTNNDATMDYGSASGSASKKFAHTWQTGGNINDPKINPLEGNSSSDPFPFPPTMPIIPDDNWRPLAAVGYVAVKTV